MSQGGGGGQQLALAHDGNEYYPASLVVLLALAISFPGMLVSDRKRLGRLDIFCDHHSLEDSWSRKNHMATWLTLGTHTTSQVGYGCL